MTKPVDPAEIGRIESEHAQQVALFAWAALNFNQYPELRWMFAIPNGGERNKIVAANLKAEGVRANVPDIFLPIPRAEWHGLFIEMKKKKGATPEGKPSVEQLGFIYEMWARGYAARVCVGWEMARDTLIQYLEWGKR